MFRFMVFTLLVAACYASFKPIVYETNRTAIGNFTTGDFLQPMVYETNRTAIGNFTGDELKPPRPVIYETNITRTGTTTKDEPKVKENQQQDCGNNEKKSKTGDNRKSVCADAKNGDLCFLDGRVGSCVPVGSCESGKCPLTCKTCSTIRLRDTLTEQVG